MHTAAGAFHPGLGKQERAEEREADRAEQQTDFDERRRLRKTLTYLSYTGPTRGLLEDS